MSFSAYVEAALYDPEDGFYATGGQAGRRGDFLTSPEVGPLFGAVIGRALDAWWDELGRPDPFVVVEGGAGPGTLARTLLRASPRCTSALVQVLVERSAAQRGRHGEHQLAWLGELGPAELAGLLATPRGDDGPAVVSVADLADLEGAGGALVGVVLANELLDNLPFDVVRRTADGVEEMRVVATADQGLDAVIAPRAPDAATGRALGSVPAGVWVPLQHEAAAWVDRAVRCLRAGRVVVLDYGMTDDDLTTVPPLGWLRTFQGHERGGHPLDDPGRQDVTADVAVDQLLRAVPGGTRRPQADFLRAHGIDELVAEGRRTWHERAHLGDLDAMRARSRVREAEALLDPDGLGGFWVIEWPVPLR
jgi:SAM-dependent MidA family methyltransferase